MESGDRDEDGGGGRGGWWWSCRVEWRKRMLVVELERIVEIDEVGGGASEESGEI